MVAPTVLADISRPFLVSLFLTFRFIWFKYFAFLMVLISLDTLVNFFPFVGPLFFSALLPARRLVCWSHPVTLAHLFRPAHCEPTLISSAVVRFGYRFASFFGGGRADLLNLQNLYVKYRCLK